MAHTQLDNKISFYICESFVKELKAVTAKYDYIDVKAYKSKCKYQQIKDPFENIESSNKKSYVLGGCTIEQNNLTPNMQMQKEDSCFHMFAPKTLVDSYIENDAYIITSGWLNHWEKYVKKVWGFDKDTATSFFDEFCKKLVLLDTLRDSKSKEELKQFASFVGQPYEIVPIGLEYFNLYVENIIKSDIAQSNNEKNQKKLDEALQNTANYAMAFDLLSKINEKLDEKEIIDKIIKIFVMLFAPENVIYSIIKDSKVIENISLNNIEKDISDELLNIEDNHILYADGFMLKLSYGNEIVGILSVENITFVQYISHYLNLAISLSGVCTLAVENARNHLKTKEIEAQLVQHEKLVSMGEMIGAIAHQWRQPLNQLNINIEMLEDYYGAGKVNEEFLDKFISKNTGTIHFLSKTISDFSNFFRIDKQKKHFSIRENIQNALDIVDMQLQTNNIIYEITGDDIEVFGLPNEFEQVILNIIYNAKDAIVESKSSDNNGKIDIELKRKDNSALITIRDSGGGIPQNVIDRVFEPYFTTKEQGKGIGMGLYISKMIIEDNLGGKLRVKNSDTGAIFEIELELKDE